MQNEENDPKKFKQVLKINPLGLFGKVLGLRRKFDGVTYFGVEAKNKNNPNNNPSQDMLQNDFYLEIENSQYNDLVINNTYTTDTFQPFSPRLFRINFDIDTMKYYIKDLYTGISTFTCINNETVLKNNSVVNIGESYILLTFGDEDNAIGSSKKQNEVELINIKVYNKASQLICDPM